METKGRRARQRQLTGLDELMAASRIMTAAVAHSLASIDSEVSMPQLRVLVMISARGPLNLTTVAEGLGVNASNASRTCDRLVTAGLLDRADDPMDRRHLVLSLTAEGERLLESLMSHRRSVLAAIVRAMKEDDRRSLARGMAAFRDAAAQATTGAPLEDDQGHLLRWLG